MNLKSAVIFTAISLMLNLLSCQKEKDPEISVIPQPLSMVQTSGIYKLTPGVKIVVPDEAGLSDQSGFLKSRILKATGFDLKVVKKSSGKTISLLMEKGLEGTLGTEGYSLSVSKKEVKVLAATPAGVFYGIQSLLQLLPPEIYADKVTEGIKWIMPLVKITDKPRFVWRGFLLDVSRHFFPASYIYDVLDYMAVHKLNRFQMHL